ncbi:MAG: hypothetical protein M0Z76_01575 [Gammaproteobacteria bacterium]|nr:hypothetical protein [Gammaproteobacteria bacterium]
MSAAADVFRERVRRVLLGQALVACAVGVAAVWAVPGAAAVLRFAAALAGGLIAMLGTWILGVTLERADDRHTVMGQVWLYGGWGVRFLLALILMFLALGVLHLPGAPLVAAFGFGQLMYAMPAGRRA